MDNMDMLRLEVGSKLVEIEDLLKDWNLPTVTGVTLVARDPNNPTGLHVVLTNGGDAEIDGAIELLRASRNGHPTPAPGEAELGREFIAWALSPENVYACEAYTVKFCVFCGATGGHEPGCLHLRARALRDSDG